MLTLNIMSPHDPKHTEKEFEEMRNSLAEQVAFLDKDVDTLLTAPLPRASSGEDPYMLMNPAHAVASKEMDHNSCQSFPRNGGDILNHQSTGHSQIRPSLSLPLVSQRLSRQESEMGDTPEERYVRRSLLANI